MLYQKLFLAWISLAVSGCALYKNDILCPEGEYNVKILIVDEDKLNGYKGLYVHGKKESLIVLPSKNTHQCAGHEIMHMCGWKHEKPSLRFCTRR